MQNAECRMQNYGIAWGDGFLIIGEADHFSLFNIHHSLFIKIGLPPALLCSSTPLINEGGKRAMPLS